MALRNRVMFCAAVRPDGVFASSPVLDRSFLGRFAPELYSRLSAAPAGDGICQLNLVTPGLATAGTASSPHS
jgi:hypothetical protein